METGGKLVMEFLYACMLVAILILAFYLARPKPKRTNDFKCPSFGFRMTQETCDALKRTECENCMECPRARS